MKKVLVIYTGGTAGMQNSESGLSPVPGFLTREMKSFHVMKDSRMPQITVREYDPLLDSSQITPAIWNKLAIDISSEYDKYDGFVILHGTDTMTYTGSALSFMLKNLSKPVVLTGAQVPLSTMISDARENLINSIYIAGELNLNEVSIYFNQKLYRANRATKVSTLSYDAFESPNYPLLGSVGPTIELRKSKLLPPPDGNDELAVIEFKTNIDLRCIKIVPSLTANTLAKVIKGAEAIILETYGDGNMPVTPDFLKVLKKACESSILVVNHSQCAQSKTQSSKYHIGSELEKVGLASSGDQTLEAVVCKLHYLMSLGLDKPEVKNRLCSNLRGECTEIVYY